jgi:amino acid transporter
MEIKSQNGSIPEVARNQFGAFAGVFTPSILTILGVIMFMKAGKVIGEAGIQNALLILLISTSITFLTGLSISAIATNTPVRGGGAYFMISRVLGPESGGAIGLALFMGQAISVPFYIIGFVKALILSYPGLAPHAMLLLCGTAALLFIMVYIGASWAIKTQFFILAILAAAIVVFLSGAASNFSIARFQTNLQPEKGFSFWIMFAIFFPAVTGIMAGVNMSGDLKKPAVAIPKGTLAAIGVGFIIYATQIFICGGAQTKDQLINSPYQTLIGQSIFGMGFVVALGVFAATLSSALGSFMGAPRVLQALSRDRIFPPLKVFGTGSTVGDEPRRALILTAVITLAVLLWAGLSGGLTSSKGGALEAVAMVVSMFFLYTYGMMNLAAFVESFGLNPSFRPRFRYFHWFTALVGAIGCGGTALLIHPGAALGALALVIGLYIYVRSQVLEAAFGDARRGFFYSRVRNNLFKLSKLPVHPKNWRPSVLALTGNPASRATMASFANWIECGRGVLSLAEIIVGEFNNLAELRCSEMRRLQTFIDESDFEAFPEVIIAKDFDEGLTTLLQAHSIGPLKPNVAMFGWPRDTDRAIAFTGHLRAAKAIGMSLAVILDRGVPKPRERVRIDIWWRGMDNGSLMLMLAHLLTRNWEWARARIRILRVVRNEEGREPATTALKDLVEAARIEAAVDVVVSDAPFKEILHAHSGDAGVVLMGFRVPEEPDVSAFDAHYMDIVSGLPTTLLISSTGEADLNA